MPATIRHALLCAALALSLAACSALPTQPIPTATVIKARNLPTETQAPPTRTPGPAPTRTLLANETPLAAAPRLTPTLPFAIISATGTAAPTALILSPTPIPLELDCKLIWQSPPSIATYHKGEKFSVGWNLRNVGTVTWEPGSFTFTYLAGARLATHDFLIPLQQSVSPGEEVVLSVPMKAPLTPSTYTTHWGIRQGDKFFCRLTLTIRVE